MSPRDRVRSIHSANDEFQLLTALLTNRTKRHRQRRFLVQGVRSINVALATGWPLVALLASPESRSRWARELLEDERVPEVVMMPRALLDELSQRDEGAEVVAVAEILDRPLAQLADLPEGVVVVAEGIGSPGNLGMIVRSADALGARAVVVTGHAADPYDPAAVRASTGALFSVPVARAASVTTVVDAVPHARVVGLHPDGDAIDAVDLTGRVLLVAGSESTGLSQKAIGLCDALAAIPMAGTTASLNVGTAVSIALAEIARREREIP